MIDLLAGTVATSFSVSYLGSPRTRKSLSSGRYFDIGSSSPIFPCSTSLITQTQVMGLVIEAIAKIVSTVIGSLLSRFR